MLGFRERQDTFTSTHLPNFERPTSPTATPEQIEAMKDWLFEGRLDPQNPELHVDVFCTPATEEIVSFGAPLPLAYCDYPVTVEPQGGYTIRLFSGVSTDLVAVQLAYSSVCIMRHCKAHSVELRKMTQASKLIGEERDIQLDLEAYSLLKSRFAIRFLPQTYVYWATIGSIRYDENDEPIIPANFYNYQINLYNAIVSSETPERASWRRSDVGV